MSGAIMMVASRSRLEGMVRAAMTPGIAHAKEDSSGMNARPGQSHPAHQPVEHEGRARQVAGVLQRQDEGEQQQDLRQEHQHAAGAGEHAIEDQAAQGPCGSTPASQALRARCRALIHACGAFAQLNTAWNMRNSTTPSSSGPPSGAARPGRARPSAAHARGHAVAGGIEHAAHLALRRLDVRGRGGRGRLQARVRTLAGRLVEAVVVDRLDELALAAGAHGDRADHRDAERLLERGAIELVAALLGDVAHVERDQHRAAEALELQHQAQVQAQVGRIDHADQQVRRRLGRMPAEHHVARDRLIECRRLQAVGTRQVDDADRCGRCAGRPGGLPCARR